MDELNILRKRTGMTIAKAWLIMISIFVGFFLSATIVGAIQAFSNKKREIEFDSILNWVFSALIVFMIIGSWFGYKINKKDVGKFLKVSFSEVLLTLLIGVCITYISPYISEFLDLDYKNSKVQSTDDVSMRFFSPLLTLAMTYLQIAVIGHGLLRNYAVREVILTILFLCTIMVVPAAVVGLAFQTIIIFYIYYRSANLTISIILALSTTIFDEILKFIVDKKYLDASNFIRYHIIHNDSVYFFGLGFALFSIPLLIYYLVKNKPTFHWQKQDEYEEIF